MRYIIPPIFATSITCEEFAFTIRTVFKCRISKPRQSVVLYTTLLTFIPCCLTSPTTAKILWSKPFSVVTVLQKSWTLLFTHRTITMCMKLKDGHSRLCDTSYQSNCHHSSHQWALLRSIIAISETTFCCAKMWPLHFRAPMLFFSTFFAPRRITHLTF